MTERMMAKQTLEYLEGKKVRVWAELQQLTGDVDGHQRQELHDDAGIPFRRNQLETELNAIGDLSRVEIYEQNGQPDVVKLGRTVSLQFLEEDGSDPEEYYVGTTDDAIFGDSSGLGKVLTVDSPTGKSILGKSEGDTVNIKLSPEREINIIIQSVK